MNEAKLRQLLRIFEESQVEELELQHSFWRGTRIRLSRRGRRPPLHPAEGGGAAASSSPASSEGVPSAPLTTEPALHCVTSPMVGTFYRSSSPDAEPLVREGDRVRIGQTICIIEAMKIMNEIPSDAEGEVVEIAIDNATPVEFGQPLVKIRAS